jgi:hypothetical protein
LSRSIRKRAGAHAERKETRRRAEPASVKADQAVDEKPGRSERKKKESR